MQVRIGRVRANDGLALHLEIDGRTCSSARKIHVEALTRNTEGARLCKVCFNPKRITNAALAKQSGRYIQKTEIILTWAQEAIATDAQRARSAELVARYHANRPVHSLSAFGQIKANHAAARQLVNAA